MLVIVSRTITEVIVQRTQVGRDPDTQWCCSQRHVRQLYSCSNTRHTTLGAVVCVRVSSCCSLRLVCAGQSLSGSSLPFHPPTHTKQKVRHIGRIALWQVSVVWSRVAQAHTLPCPAAAALPDVSGWSRNARYQKLQAH